MLLNPDSMNFLPDAAGNINQMLNGANLMRQLQMMQADPFERRSRADLLLGESMPQNIMPDMPENLLPSQVPTGDMQNLAENVPPTDFFGTSPGLPNLRDDYTGFGYGQNAPKIVNEPAQQQLGGMQDEGNMMQMLQMLAQQGLI